MVGTLCYALLLCVQPLYRRGEETVKGIVVLPLVLLHGAAMVRRGPAARMCTSQRFCHACSANHGGC